MAFCVSCGSEMQNEWNSCPSCGTPKGGTATVVSAPQIIQQPIMVAREPKSKGIAFLLNFLIAGAGHMYLDNTDRGLPVAIISTLCALILIGLPIWLILWIWMLVDTTNQYQIYLQKNGFLTQ
tara:strand:- start:77 stop:445 length:369 start_codon:yes stop_codon:yes gene_type:complete